MKDKRRKIRKIEAITPRNLNFSTDDILCWKFSMKYLLRNAGELFIWVILPIINNLCSIAYVVRVVWKPIYTVFNSADNTSNYMYLYMMISKYSMGKDV
jgi:hypothetical protein